ncbi:MAG: succinate dehydrogenase cytochrome b subunit [Propionibacteriaceae bacterium]|nr:succinate dehydrogenase cytochrome b subunit [Propionibacteriaceae bacterium]
MASTNLSVQQKALRSSVVKKVVMAVTGLVLIAFLLMHMYGNLKIFIGPEAYNDYAEFLKQDLLAPILPHGWFIWIFRAVLFICLVLHIYCAITLWSVSVEARGKSKYVRKNRKEQTLASRFMRWGGIALFLLIVFHILMFTSNTFQLGWTGKQEPYTMFMGAFAQPWMVVIYAVFVGIVCVHIRHGFWSAFATLGANVGKYAQIVLNVIAYFVAVLVFVGFMLPPVAVCFGLVS